MNATDWNIEKADNKYLPQPDFADSRELNNLVQRGVMPNPQPIVSLEHQQLPERHFNQFGVHLTPQDQDLVQIVDIAINNGWNWRELVSEPITKGTEAESVVKVLLKRRITLRTFILNIDFAEALFGKKWKDELKELVVIKPEELIPYLKERLSNNE